ncbi:MAG: hypothetical protein OXC11_03880 [Rhodospirillales bacterium]|nr:hypothetical protein [Rhodospirillales bacterium]
MSVRVLDGGVEFDCPECRVVGLRLRGVVQADAEYACPKCGAGVVFLTVPAQAVHPPGRLGRPDYPDPVKIEAPTDIVAFPSVVEMCLSESGDGLRCLQHADHMRPHEAGARQWWNDGEESVQREPAPGAPAGEDIKIGEGSTG